MTVKTSISTSMHSFYKLKLRLNEYVYYRFQFGLRMVFVKDLLTPHFPILDFNTEQAG